MKFATAILAAFFAVSSGVYAQSKPHESPRGEAQRNGKVALQRISLSPRFIPGQVFRYEMEFETTTVTKRSGLTADPQGSSKLVITWDATIRLEILPAEANAPGATRLRTVYEKSTANIRSDSFDPTASVMQEQYQKLEGKTVEFTIDSTGNVISVSGLEDIVDGEKTVQAARDWIAQLDAGSGAPAGGLSVGQKWSSDQAATTVAIPGMVWRTDSEYLRNEDCRPQNPNGAPARPGPPEECAVILTSLGLVQSKTAHKSTVEKNSKDRVQTAGKWNGSGQSLSYISLRTGLAVSVTQTGSEEINVTLTTNHNTSMHYEGTIVSRSQVALVANDLDEK